MDTPPVITTMTDSSFTTNPVLDWVVVALLFFSIILLILSITFYLYYGINNWLLAVFSIGIIAGFCACGILLWIYWPQEVMITPVVKDPIDTRTVNADDYIYEYDEDIQQPTEIAIPSARARLSL